MKTRSKIINILFITIYIVVFCSIDISFSQSIVENIEKPENLPKNLDIDAFSLPGYLGQIKDVYKGSSGNCIIHIQDAHCNYAAQKKIRSIIEYLIDRYSINVINLEGGAGEYDLSVFNQINDVDVRKEVADDFVKSGVLSGAEDFAIADPKASVLWGVEDVELYLENLKVYRNASLYKEEASEYLNLLGSILTALKRHIYSPELIEIDKNFYEYKTGAIEFKEYINYLISKAIDKEVDITLYSNINLLKQSLIEEGKINFKKAEDERKTLMDRLIIMLSKKEAQKLVLKSVNFKQNIITQDEYYKYLARKASFVSLDMERFPEFSKYLEYISLYHAIDRTKLMDEVSSLEGGIREILCENDTQNKLNQFSIKYVLLKKLSEFSLTTDEYLSYSKIKKDLNMDKFRDFISKECDRYGIKGISDGKMIMLEKYLNRIVKFYEWGYKRDNVFLENLRFNMPDSQEKTLSSILVTGGFHEDNLCELFKQKNISYISVIPHFKTSAEIKNPYFDLLSGKTTESDRVLASFLTSESMIAIASMLSPMLAENVYGSGWEKVLAAKVYIDSLVKKGNFVVLENGQVFGEKSNILKELTREDLLKAIAPEGQDSDLKEIIMKRLTDEDIEAWRAAGGTFNEFGIPVYSMHTADGGVELVKMVSGPVLRVLLAVNNLSNGLQEAFPEDDKEVIEKAVEKVGLTGGFVRNLWFGEGYMSDVDLFLPGGKYDEAIIKLIKKETGLSVDVLGYNKNFDEGMYELPDFTMNKLVIFSGGELMDKSGEALSALEKKELKLTHRTSQPTSMKRVLRAIRFLMIGENWNIDPESEVLLKMAYNEFWKDANYYAGNGVDGMKLYDLFNISYTYESMMERINDIKRTLENNISREEVEARYENLLERFNAKPFVEYMDACLEGKVKSAQMAQDFNRTGVFEDVDSPAFNPLFVPSVFTLTDGSVINLSGQSLDIWNALIRIEKELIEKNQKDVSKVAELFRRVAVTGQFAADLMEGRDFTGKTIELIVSGGQNFDKFLIKKFQEITGLDIKVAGTYAETIKGEFNQTAIFYNGAIINKDQASKKREADNEKIRDLYRQGKLFPEIALVFMGIKPVFFQGDTTGLDAFFPEEVRRLKLNNGEDILYNEIAVKEIINRDKGYYRRFGDIRNIEDILRGVFEKGDIGEILGYGTQRTTNTPYALQITDNQGRLLMAFRVKKNEADSLATRYGEALEFLTGEKVKIYFSRDITDQEKEYVDNIISERTQKAKRVVRDYSQDNISIIPDEWWDKTGEGEVSAVRYLNFNTIRIKESTLNDKKEMEEAFSDLIEADIQKARRYIKERQKVIELSLSEIQNKDNIIKTVAGVPAGIEYEAILNSMLHDVNVNMANAGFGIVEVSSSSKKGDKRQILTFEIYTEGPDFMEKTRASYLAAMKKAEKLLENQKKNRDFAQGHIVLFAPEMVEGPKLLTEAMDEYKNRDEITVYPDAYTDCSPKDNRFTDIDVRAVFARHLANIRIYKQKGNKEGLEYAIKALNALKEAVNMNISPITEDLIDKLVSGTLSSEEIETLLLEIEPIDYQDIVDWAESQKAVDTSL